MSARFLSRLQPLGATPDALDALKAVLQSPSSYPSDSVIVNPGEAATHLHIVEEGWACASRNLLDGREQIVAAVLPGDVCDVEALALGRCSSRVAALSPCRIVRLSLRPLRDLLAREASLVGAFQSLSALERLIATEWMINLGRRSAAERISHLLCELAVRLDAAPADGAVRFAFPMTQTDLADATGLSVVHVNRSLQALRREVGLVIERRQVTISSWADLVKLAAFNPEYLSVTSSPPVSAPARRRAAALLA